MYDVFQVRCFWPAWEGLSSAANCVGGLWEGLIVRESIGPLRPANCIRGREVGVLGSFQMARQALRC